MHSQKSSTNRSLNGQGTMECACEFNSDEILVLHAILEFMLKTKRFPTIRELASLLKEPHDAIMHLVRELEKKDALATKNETQKIASVYPFSLEPTKHQVVLQDGSKLFAMCAVDALGVPIMAAGDAKIVSRCETCDQEVVVEIRNDQIAFVSHPDIVVCSTKAPSRPLAEGCCPYVNFFCSKKHADDWIAGNLGLERGFNLESIRNKFPKIRENWKAYGKMLGFR